MATYKNGILGGFSGKVGPVVGSTWRNKHVLRSLPSKSNKAPSAQQLDLRSKFGLVSSFLAPLGPLIKETFTYQFGCETRRGAAISYYNKEVAQPATVGYEINYAKMLISTGVLRGLAGTALQAETGHHLKVTWADNSPQGMAAGSHLLTLVLYASQPHEFFLAEHTAQRLDLQAQIEVPEALQSQTLHVWGFFSQLSIMGEIEQVSNSDYLGEVSW